jgi:hypothetical protein
MDIEFAQNQLKWEGVFRSIDQFDVTHLYEQEVTLENNFMEKIEDSHNGILLTLIRDTLLLSDPNAAQVQPIAAT